MNVSTSTVAWRWTVLALAALGGALACGGQGGEAPGSGGTPSTVTASGGAPGAGGAHDIGGNLEAGGFQDVGLGGAPPTRCPDVDAGSTSGSDAGSCAVTLVPGESAVAVAVDATSVYWVTIDPSGSGKVMKASRGGGAPILLASEQRNPTAVAVDAASVYWTNDVVGGSVMKVALAGGQPTTLAAGQASPSTIAIDATSVYWMNQDPLHGAALMKVSRDGGPTITLASDLSLGFPISIAVDATSIYWTFFPAISGAGGVMRMPLSGGGSAAPNVLYSGSARGVAVDATSVYWTVEGTCDGVVMAEPLAGGPPTRLVSGPGDPGAGSLGSPSAIIAVDATSVYWVNDGGIMKVPLGGGPRIRLASGRPTALAVDSGAAYWISGGSVMGLGTCGCDLGECKDGSAPDSGNDAH